MKEKTKIFICHAKEDKEKALQIYDLLKREGYNPWLDNKNLVAGQNWKIEISKAIKEADFVIPLFSKLSVNKKGYVQKEFKLSLEILDEVPDDQIFLIPVRLDECDIPFDFMGIHYCDYSGENDFNKINKAIEYERFRFKRESFDTSISKPFGLITKARQGRDRYGIPFIEIDTKGVVIRADHHLEEVEDGQLKGNAEDLIIEALSRAVADAESLKYYPEWVVAYITLGPTDYPEDEYTLTSLFTDKLGFIEYWSQSSNPKALSNLVRDNPKQKGSLSTYIYFYTPLKKLRSRLKKYYVTRIYVTNEE